MWPILIWAEGGDIVGPDGCSLLGSPETVAAVKSWADIIVEKGISPAGLTGQDADNLVAAGKAAMEMNGPWAAGSYTAAGIDFDVAPIPKGSADQVTLASSVPFVVNKATQHPAEVKTFLAWWNSPEAQKALALGSGFPPTRSDMADDPDLAANPWVPKFAAAVPYSRPYLANVPGFTQVDEIFSTAIGRVTRGEDAQAVLTEAAAQMNAVLGCE
jgi:ABC-type glycerol-3-phosphate transport system substrate-binding protein